MTAGGHFDAHRLETALARAALSLEPLAALVDPDLRTLERIRSGKTLRPHPQTVAKPLARRLCDARGLGEPRESAPERFRAEAENRIALWWRSLAERDRATLQRAARGDPVDDRRLRQRGEALRSSIRPRRTLPRS